jgi:hypothetical protein
MSRDEYQNARGWLAAEEIDCELYDNNANRLD